jgi:circadian clock protein KaiB
MTPKPDIKNHLTKGDEVMEKVVLKLYVSGKSPRYKRVIEEAHRICEKLSGYDVQLEVIDIREHPEVAGEDSILATPTLMKKLPLPIRRIIGDLFDSNKVLMVLDLAP